MPQALPALATIVGGVVSSAMQSKASKTSETLIQMQMQQQQRAMDLQMAQTQAEQQRAQQLQDYQIQTDKARKARAEASYLTEGGEAAGQSTTLAKRTLLGAGGYGQGVI